MNKLKVGIIPNFTREKTLNVTINTIDELENLNIDYFFDISLKNNVALEINEKHFIDNIFEHVDVIIAIGGDGSFIHTAKQSAVHKKPVLCINAGNLAFLAGLEGNELNLIERLDKFKENHLMFASDFSVDFTNNTSERGLRTVKRKQLQQL